MEANQNLDTQNPHKTLKLDLLNDNNLKDKMSMMFGAWYELDHCDRDCNSEVKLINE